MKTSIRLFPLIFFALSLSFLTSCKKNLIIGSGAIITETRNVSDFYNVAAYANTEVKINYGTAYKVEVKGYESLVPHLNTFVENGTLFVRFNKNVNVQDEDVDVRITMPQLKSISVYENGEAELLSAFPNMDNLKVLSSDRAEIDLKAGSANLLKAELSGSGKIKGFGLLAKKVQAEMIGSGKIEVSVSDNLNVNIDGSGTVYYKGNPELYTQITGAGQVIKK
ncbi:MAG TPA: DUF2807 domain-containing protein [Ginsengibacter sp.]|nr:DUF2807 domain-containing protein [Ginsengibacter sp.]HRP43766.1 DUF2807 domain-containing protein [Ginsengibacter sp.]